MYKNILLKDFNTSIQMKEFAPIMATPLEANKYMNMNYMHKRNQ